MHLVDILAMRRAFLLYNRVKNERTLHLEGTRPTISP
jgi:hypothetical protein